MVKRYVLPLFLSLCLPLSCAVPAFGMQAESTPDITADAGFFAPLFDAANGILRLLHAMLLPAGEAAALGTQLAKEAEYTLRILENGSVTVDIALYIADDPAFFCVNPNVSRAFAQQAVIEQQKYAPPDAAMMDEAHIAGELRFHALGYLGILFLGGRHGLFASPFESFSLANLNIDENRVPSCFLDLFV